MRKETNWRKLIKPKFLEIDKKSLTPTYGKFIAAPLERGFGITIGNSLRRILLSSIRGAAVVGVKIKGVTHEFSTLPGITEDVSDILLNLKELIIQTHSDQMKSLRINAKGECVVTAKDIEHDSSVEILNPDLQLATLSKGASLDMELYVNSGKGFVLAEQNRKDGLPANIIPVDSIFSPIRKVNYAVTHARVGQMTDYDRLVFEVWTNGSISPEDAIAFAAKIQKEQLQIFINFDEAAIPEEQDEVVQSPEDTLNSNLLKTVEELELSVRSANCLQNADIQYIGDLVQKSEGEMLRTKNFGRKSLNEIKEILTEMGLSLGMKLDSWPPENLSELLSSKSDDEEAA